MSGLQVQKTIASFRPYSYVAKKDNKFYLVISNPHEDDDSWNQITPELFNALVHFNVNYSEGME